MHNLHVAIYCILLFVSFVLYLTPKVLRRIKILGILDNPPVTLVSYEKRFGDRKGSNFNKNFVAYINIRVDSKMTQQN